MAGTPGSCQIAADTFRCYFLSRDVSYRSLIRRWLQETLKESHR